MGLSGYTEIDANGKFVFEGDEALDHGMYMVVIPRLVIRIMGSLILLPVYYQSL
ncbi:hypothetical protein N9Y89_02115 [bacterium]|nr:hypothetical protein [bacterium]